MISFLLSIVVLVVGYFTYGVFLEKVLGIDRQRKTPAFGDAVESGERHGPRGVGDQQAVLAKDIPQQLDKVRPPALPLRLDLCKKLM